MEHGGRDNRDTERGGGGEKVGKRETDGQSSIGQSDGENVCAVEMKRKLAREGGAIRTKYRQKKRMGQQK